MSAPSPRYLATKPPCWLATIADPRVVDLQQFLHILRVETGGERRRSNEVTEHDRELSPLGPIGSLLTGRLRRRGR